MRIGVPAWVGARGWRRARPPGSNIGQRSMTTLRRGAAAPRDHPARPRGVARPGDTAGPSSADCGLAGATLLIDATFELLRPRHPRTRTPAQPESASVAARAGAHRDILCVQESRVVGNDHTIRDHGLVLQIPPRRSRPPFVKLRGRVHAYPDGTRAIFHGPRCLARSQADGGPLDQARPWAARRRPGLWARGQRCAPSTATSGHPMCYEHRST
jgi:hypothetical protein